MKRVTKDTMHINPKTKEAFHQAEKVIERKERRLERRAEHVTKVGVL
ncbi:hypothetical protein ACPF7I_09070 [Anoxybacillus sp. D401a]